MIAQNVRHALDRRRHRFRLARAWRSGALIPVCQRRVFPHHQPRHKEFVQATLAKLNDAGHFYTATCPGFYSAREETFLTEKDRLPAGTFDASYGEVVELKEAIITSSSACTSNG